MTSRDRINRTLDATDSWLRVGFIVTLIVVNGIWEELQIQGAEAMMLIRWSRDVIRYDLRWAVEEKVRRTFRRRKAVNQE